MVRVVVVVGVGVGGGVMVRVNVRVSSRVLVGCTVTVASSFAVVVGLRLRVRDISPVMERVTVSVVVSGNVVVWDRVGLGGGVRVDDFDGATVSECVRCVTVACAVCDCVEEYALDGVADCEGVGVGGAVTL